MFRRGRWRIAALATGIVGAVTAGMAAAVPAGAATLNQWRTASLWGASGNLNSVAATSKTNAWAVGNISTGPLAARWNGRAWQTVAVPGSKGWAFQQVLAPQASNVWIYAVNSASGAEQVFRFDGAHWHTIALPVGGFNFASLTVMSPNDAWILTPSVTPAACSNVSGPCSDLWHWNGSSWADNTFKAHITQLAGLPGTPVLWAVGVTGAQAPSAKGIITAYRWTGRAWQHAVMPSVSGYWPGVAIDASNDLWISYDNLAITHGYTQHWNGARWSTVNAGGHGTDTPVPDGRGGAWFGPQSHWTGRAFVLVPISPSGLSSGAWSLQAEAVVPGTSGASVWSVGWNMPSTVQHPAVAIYGPTP